jgi:F-type H+-transporting ATPase subunit delta
LAVVHKIYAQALLAAAKEHGSLPQIREEFEDFARAVQESDELRALLRNPQIDPPDKWEILDDLTSGADDAFRNFVRLLTEKNRLPELLEICAEWERLLAAEERVLEVELTTAIELSDHEAAEIVGRIEKEARRKVEATRSVDPNLIGGLILQAGSLRVDGSVRGRLNELREELLQRA